MNYIPLVIYFLKIIQKEIIVLFFSPGCLSAMSAVALGMFVTWHLQYAFEHSNHAPSMCE